MVRDKGYRVKFGDKLKRVIRLAIICLQIIL